MNQNSRIVLVEDDEKLAASLSRGLEEAGYFCAVAGRVKEAEALLCEELPALVLLDMGLPDGDGSDLLRFIRTIDTELPVIITTARSGVTDRVGGLEGGADDYLVKPYAFEELLARIRIQLRHSDRVRLQRSVGDLTLDLPSRRAERAGRLLDLTPREFDLLAYLVSLRGEVATRQMLQENVWKVHSAMASMANVIDVHISRLRQKLEEPGEPPLLHTVRGVGFILKEDV
ncbi:response regulator transcription factor [Pontiella agarivorans]|uniref:Response regulator transcription factor n=1 Tax=Pontiella agarivorans TaxID=3038953 RepID=A0ABU5MZV8_9BACT|nr:response regulator transcription factor [Pontiella agarivorans]MDZ8119720.1 response regulator transcription factor [Pontiella agarivorans]